MSPMPLDKRLQHIRRFYEMLDHLEARVGGKRTLATASGRLDWPARGVYFFFEPGEARSTSGSGPRVTHVGTHALRAGSKTTLWGRLRQHRGTTRGATPGGGYHRMSVFRLHVGTALIRRDDWPEEVSATWAVGSSAERDVYDREYPLERAVSRHIRAMPFLWLGIDDEPGPDSLRGDIERNAIALLSNHNHRDAPLDPPSSAWLGRWATSEQVRLSGLWNVNHVTEDYDHGFLKVLEQHIL